MSTVDVWDNEAVNAALRKQGVPEEYLAVHVAYFDGEQYVTEETNRIAALVALCEEVIDIVAENTPGVSRSQAASYRARLAQLKGDAR